MVWQTSKLASGEKAPVDTQVSIADRYDLKLLELIVARQHYSFVYTAPL